MVGEDTGADAPSVGQFLRRHHILANDTVQMSLCYETSRHAPVPAVTLRVPKAADPSAGLSHSGQVSYGFFQSLLLISRSKTRGLSKLGRTELFPAVLLGELKAELWLVFALYRKSGCHTVDILLSPNHTLSDPGGD